MPRTMLIVDLTNIAVRCGLGGAVPAGKAAQTAANYVAKVCAALDVTHLVCTVDHPAPSWRRELAPDYKAGRNLKTTPYSAAAVEEVRGRGWVVLEEPTFEADDLIATVTERAVQRFDVLLLSGDSDVAALVRPGTDLHGSVVQVWPKNGGTWELRDHEAVCQLYQLPEPRRLADFKAISGEPGDNVPGLAGRTASGAVAERKAVAAKLLAAFGTLDAVITAGADNASREARECWLARERLLLARQLVTLRVDVPLPQLQPSECAIVQAPRPAPALHATTAA
jgi:5'-3' exonuclease